ncbi:ABC transporter permease [Rhodanobacter sp. FDAARGOS 1247]|uniref:ABC transporter permease n=1 Tax=Rhodanobacter sp. FDAARGOS 1247 TaxID=2778082 RepID=UPI0019517DD8|nr:ABC transporter permease [Rhodanobacter sp. FDAARGOS 1247]QRP64261.1 ABC transporter permease [Rhodanobacter sp. FDAARGOS 1247]
MTLLAVARLEWRRLLVRPLAWVLAALTLAWLAWNFTLLLGIFLAGQIQRAAQPDGPGFVDLVGVPLLGQLAQLAFLVVPLLGMSVIAGERRNGTLPLMFAAGVPASRIVLGKYLALLGWLLLWLALTLAMPLALMHATHFDWGKLAAASLGLALMLATLAAIAVACSSFASHPAIAAAAALVIALALWSVNQGAQLAGINGGAVNWLAMSSHLQPLLRGLVSSADIAWFVLLAALSLALATRRLVADRERG